jgi:uncharacterized protein (TIGR02270 family)
MTLVEGPSGERSAGRRHRGRRTSVGGLPVRPSAMEERNGGEQVAPVFCPSIVPDIVQQHVDNAAALHHRRVRLVTAPHVALDGLRRLDERLEAHLSGLMMAGEYSWRLCDEALELPSRGSVFVSAVRAIHERHLERLERLYGLTQAVEETRGGLLAAYGWPGRDKLRGLVAALLGAVDPFKRFLGVAACSLHRVDPGLLSGRLLDPDKSVRARALRLAGEVGYREGSARCTAVARDEDAEVGFWAARSAVLLGDRTAGLEVLIRAGLADGPHRRRAFRLSLQAMTQASAHRLLQDVAQAPGRLQWLIEGSGVSGNAAYVPWLVSHMRQLETARQAGEAFTLITGAGLAEHGLDHPRPEGFRSGPTDDPEDEHVEMDPDDDLPWPDVGKVEKWWAANASRFQKGVRYFVGAPVTRGHCIDVLKTGYQRQRILAAHYLCLVEPGTPLFNTSAPAWRQQRLLSTM